MILSLPPLEFLSIAVLHRWVECGAGSGLWIRIFRDCGIDIIGYDPEPRSIDVIRGDHTSLAEHSDRALLIVWPPDGTDVSEWVSHHGGSTVALCGDFRRFLWPELPVTQEWVIEGGLKGRSTLKLMDQRNA